MDEPKFTPGEWVAHLHADGAFSIKPAGDYDTSPMLASRNQWKQRAEESHANALLFAASKRMYEALEMAKEYLEDADACDGETYETVCAALAAAKGTT